MASGAASRTVRAPGRIVVNPVDLGDLFPFGGIEVGWVRGAALASLGTNYRVQCEARGEASDILEGSNYYVFSFLLRGVDDEAKRYLLSDGYEAGSVSQHSVHHVPGTVTPGASALGRAVKLLYLPDDPVHVDAVLIYRGVPMLGDSEIPWQRETEYTVPVMVDCMQDTNGNTIRWGRFADLTLT